MTDARSVVPRFDRRRALATLALVYLGFSRVTADRGFPMVCPFRRLTEARCPLCGLSTGIGRALQADVRGAIRAHPLSLPALAGALSIIRLGVGTGHDGQSRVAPRRA
jgi:uncharacterized protein DUF2752